MHYLHYIKFRLEIKNIHLFNKAGLLLRCMMGGSPWPAFCVFSINPFIYLRKKKSVLLLASNSNTSWHNLECFCGSIVRHMFKVFLLKKNTYQIFKKKRKRKKKKRRRSNYIITLRVWVCCNL